MQHSAHARNGVVALKVPASLPHSPKCNAGRVVKGTHGLRWFDELRLNWLLGSRKPWACTSPALHYASTETASMNQHVSVLQSPVFHINVATRSWHKACSPVCQQVAKHITNRRARILVSADNIAHAVSPLVTCYGRFSTMPSMMACYYSCSPCCAKRSLDASG